MEMPILILEQQQAPVTTPATNGKTANAKQADAGQESFKSTFNKAMEDSDKGKAPPVQGETESAQGEEKTLEEPCAANTFFIAVPVIYNQPAMEMPADTVPASIESTGAIDTVNTMPDIGNGGTAQPEIPVISRPETPVTVAPVSLQKSDLVDLQEASKVQNGTPEVAAAPVQNSNSPADSTAKTAPIVIGQEESDPVQNVQLMPKEMTGEPAVAVPAGPETAADNTAVDNKAVDNKANAGLSTQPPDMTAVVTEGAKGEIKAMPLKAEEQPGEKDGNKSKEALTTIAVPVTEATEKQTLTNGFSSDTTDNPSVTTPAGAMPSTKAETVNVPFPEVKTPPPVKEQVFQEIVQKARFMSHGTQQTIQMQLKPEHLGLLNLQIAVENGAVTAKFQTDNPQVKQMLEASFNQLKQDLQTQGLKVQHVEVSLAQQGMSFSDFSRQTPQFSLIKSKRIVPGEDDMAEQSPARVSLIENYGGLHSGGVDYRI